MKFVRTNLSDHRCPGCEIRKPLCFCEWIPQISLQTRVLILMHKLERMLTTNTAKLAHRALTNSEIQVHGLKNDCLSAADLHEPNRTSLLLYPSPFAKELTHEFVAALTQPVTLIVPDASWRQTKKFVRRTPALAGIQHVVLPAGQPSEYRLRVQPQDTGLCTLEAIARSIGIIEDRGAQEKLETMLRVMVERTLWSRGLLARELCKTAGIPREAYQH